MYDIHSHILPATDDGAANLEEAVNMAAMAKENGVKAILATPHYIEGTKCKDYITNVKTLEVLKSELVARGIDIDIFIGCEVYSTPNILELLKQEKITTLNNSQYMLIEFPMYDIPIYIEEMIYNLKLNGITPIIAHPERNAKIIEDPNILYRFILLGALGQLNLPSLLGGYGDRVEKTAKILLENDMIHFVGTDAHRASQRFYDIKSSINILEGLIGSEKTAVITQTNPMKVINGEDIEISEPRIFERKNIIRRIFSRFTGK